VVGAHQSIQKRSNSTNAGRVGTSFLDDGMIEYIKTIYIVNARIQCG
jgi:hypothetical protein